MVFNILAMPINNRFISSMSGTFFTSLWLIVFLPSQIHPFSCWFDHEQFETVVWLLCYAHPLFNVLQVPIPCLSGDLSYHPLISPNVWLILQSAHARRRVRCLVATSFPGSLFSASIVVEKTTFLNDNGGREERPWERGWSCSLAHIRY